MLTYEPFDLLLSPTADGYQARVIDSPSGQASTTFRLPSEINAIKDNLGLVGGAIRAFKYAGADRAIEPLDPRSFGEMLFTALFQGEVEQVLRRSLALTQNKNQGLRLRLRLDETPELAALPWEYLYDPSGERYLVLSEETPVVRYLALPQVESPLAVDGPLRILVLTADAKDYTRLNIAAEEARLRNALDALETQGDVEITWLSNGTLSDLRRTLRREEYHIFHFIGHGWFTDHIENGLLLVDEEGNGLKVSADTLGINLHNHRTLRLALLNACEGARIEGDAGEPFAGVAQHLVQQGLPAVIAMQFPVTDKAAIELTREFYSAIADRYPVDRALTQARLAIYSQESVMEWGTPVLFMRAADGRLWQGDIIEAATKTEQSTSTMINTGGGPYVGGNVSVGGESVGRDKIVHGDEVKGDKVLGDKIAGNKIEGYSAGNDVIAVTVGAGAKNVAAGKNIAQVNIDEPEPTSDEERQRIVVALENLATTVSALDNQRMAIKAEVHVETIQQELAKVDGVPNSGAITNATAWLFRHTPDVAPTLNELLALPAVKCMLAQNENQSGPWWRRWFG